MERVQVSSREADAYRRWKSCPRASKLTPEALVGLLATAVRASDAEPGATCLLAWRWHAHVHLHRAHGTCDHASHCGAHPRGPRLEDSL